MILNNSGLFRANKLGFRTVNAVRRSLGKNDLPENRFKASLKIVKGPGHLESLFVVFKQNGREVCEVNSEFFQANFKGI